MSHFGDRLMAVVLYGSVARGEETPESDVDLLIVAEGLPRSPWARGRLKVRYWKLKPDDRLPGRLSERRGAKTQSFLLVSLCLCASALNTPHARPPGR